MKRRPTKRGQSRKPPRSRKLPTTTVLVRCNSCGATRDVGPHWLADAPPICSECNVPMKPSKAAVQR